MHSGELCARLVMTEQLQRPTLELTHALRELMFALGDAGAATAPHTGAVVHSQRCDCYVHLESFGNTGATVVSPYRSSRTCLMMEMLFTLNADNGQIFFLIGLEIGLVSRGSFR